MILINSQFLKVIEDEIQARINQEEALFKTKHPEAKLIRLDSGDVIRPVAPCVVKAMQKGALEMGSEDTFKGRSPVEGYDFILEAIVKYNQKVRKLDFLKSEIFINDGTKDALTGIGDILCRDNRIAVIDPVFQTYIEANVIGNRAGEMDDQQRWSHIIYLNCNKENNFIPELPKVRPDVIYLSYPNDPTGCVMTKEQLSKWVKYAIDNNSLILYDATYEWFISEPNIPHSIYEIKGAKKCAIEFRSFSKSAGFTGLNCGYIIIPKEIEGYSFSADATASLNKLWRRRQQIKNHAPSYITQKGAEALFSKEGVAGVRTNVDYYMRNAEMLRNALSQADFTYWGGVNSPFIWVESPYGGSSWKLFDRFLNECHILSSPGERFGQRGKGFVRLSSFANQTKVMMASVRIADMRI